MGEEEEGRFGRSWWRDEYDQNTVCNILKKLINILKDPFSNQI